MSHEINPLCLQTAKHSKTFFPTDAMEAATFHVTFIAEDKDFAVSYATLFTLRMKNSSHMVPSFLGKMEHLAHATCMSKHS